MPRESAPRKVFVTGATGYLGRHLVPELVEAGHDVVALVRAASRHRLLGGVPSVAGDALDADSYAPHVSGAHTFVHLVGTSRPNPLKAAQFRAVDLASVRAAVQAAARAGVRHFVYVSVAQPAPVMQAYVAVRAECEALIAGSGLDATVLRPWYVLGPGHRWPYLLIPVYRLAERLPQTAGASRRLGLVTLPQMIAALGAAVREPAAGLRIVDVPQIRRHAAARPALETDAPRTMRT